jgi:peptidylprolyl isomerase domain and WD repeat-containing protein 1
MKRSRSCGGASSSSSDDDFGPRLPSAPPCASAAPAAAADGGAPAAAGGAPAAAADGGAPAAPTLSAGAPVAGATAAPAAALRAPAAPPPAPPAGPTPAQLASYVASLPSSARYERSYLHRDVLSHVAFAPGTDFLITASVDGCVKFWKKTAGGVAFVKTYRTHVGQLASLAVSHDGARLATTGDDGTLKLFDVASFDMAAMARLPFSPSSAAAWVYPRGAAAHPLALGDRNTPAVFIMDGDGGGGAPLARVALHAAPVLALAYHPGTGLVVSADSRGVMEVWGGDNGEGGYRPRHGLLAFGSKVGTDLFALARARVAPTAVTWAPDGRRFAVAATDSRVLVFNTATGALLREWTSCGGSDAPFHAPEVGLPRPHAAEAARRAAAETALSTAAEVAIKALLAPPTAAVPTAAATAAAAAPPPHRPPPSNPVFDETGNLVLFPGPRGVLIGAIDSGVVVSALGGGESERFLGLALFQGVPSGGSQLPASGGGAALAAPVMGAPGGGARAPDPTLFAAAFGRPRFYCFSTRPPAGVEDSDGGGGGDGAPEDDAAAAATAAAAEKKGDVDAEALAAVAEEAAARRRRALAARDAANEPPHPADPASAGHFGGLIGGARAKGVSAAALPRSVCLATDAGEVWVALFPEVAPKAVENFVTLCRRGYYDKCLFFRVIEDFMVQTGDPTNSGCGGESIWGREFEDEVSPTKRFDGPGVLGMANAGPRTNGSQFFITAAATPHLNGKHTVFGKVTKGLDVVLS